MITQSYEDHCHLATLKLLNPATPILATHKAFNRLTKAFPNRQVIRIPHDGDVLNFEGLTFAAFRPKKLLDPIYFALSVFTDADRTVFYAPHGFVLSQKQMQLLNDKNIALLISTFTDFKLPEILGGHVNPGVENVMALCQQLKPKTVINTHDEQKAMKGLVAKSARVKYPDFAALESNNAFNFLQTPDYEAIHLQD